MRFRHLSICLLLTVLPLTRSRLAADELPSWVAIGPDGGNVQALAVSPALPRSILAGLENGYGIFISHNRGRNWGAASDTFGKAALSLAIDAEAKAFYAATSRGLLKSTTGGALWTALDASADYTLVAAHPRKAAIVFAVRGGVLLRSADGGVTRTVTAGPEGVADIAFALAPRRTVVYAAAANGFWRSTDDGRTWTDKSPPFASLPQVEAVAVDPRDPRILYIGLRHPRRVLLKSLDGGTTWQPSQRGLQPARSRGPWPAVSELAVDPANPATVYAVAGGELFRSINGGGNWSRPVPELPGGFVNALETTGFGVLAGTPAGVLLSTDRGLTWRLRVAYLTATSIDAMAIDQQEPARLYAASPAGVFSTSIRERPWLRLRNGASVLAVDPDSSILYAGADSGLVKSTDGGRNWTAAGSFGCLAASSFAFDPRQPARVFALGGLRGDRVGCLEPYICTFLRSLDAGESWHCLAQAFEFFPGSGSSLLGVEPFTSALFLRDSSGALFRSTNDGESWTYLGQSGVTSFAASPLVAGTLWIGRGAAVSRSRDGGQTWQSFSTGLPADQSVIALAPDPVNPTTLYAATRQSGIFKSVDAGETWSLAGLWPSGVDHRGNLLVDPREPAIVYAGTDGLGVLRLDQRGN